MEVKRSASDRLAGVFELELGSEEDEDGAGREDDDLPPADFEGEEELAGKAPGGAFLPFERVLVAIGFSGDG